MNEFLIDTMETAKALYQLSCDIDFPYYAETQKQELSEIENALYHIKTICENDLNFDYWRTFARCLDSITEKTTINENIFCD